MVDWVIKKANVKARDFVDDLWSTSEMITRKMMMNSKIPCKVMEVLGERPIMPSIRRDGWFSETGRNWTVNGWMVGQKC